MKGAVGDHLPDPANQRYLRKAIWTPLTGIAQQFVVVADVRQCRLQVAFLLIFGARLAALQVDLAAGSGWPVARGGPRTGCEEQFEND